MKWTPDGSVSFFRKPIFAGSYPDGVQIGSAAGRSISKAA